MVGDDVLMAWGATVIDTDTHAVAWEGRRGDAGDFYREYLKDPANALAGKRWEGVVCKPVHIGSKSWVGFNSIVLKGTRLGDEVIVGAGSVVTKSFADGVRVAGNPAREL